MLCRGLACEKRGHVSKGHLLGFVPPDLSGCSHKCHNHGHLTDCLEKHSLIFCQSSEGMAREGSHFSGEEAGCKTVPKTHN